MAGACTHFFVPGIPVPKGSAKAFMRKGMRFPVVMQDNAEKQKPWASLIAYTAMQNNPVLIATGVRVDMHFYFPRPKSQVGKRGLKPSAPGAHLTKPDLDKLVRCVFDALTGICYHDDSQICSQEAHKGWVDERFFDGRAGVLITVRPG